MFKKLIFIAVVGFFTNGIFVSSAFAVNTQWDLIVKGTQFDVSYVDFMDTTACGGDNINAYSGAGNVNSGNNNCVDFTVSQPSISSASDQTFKVGQSATAISPITITDTPGGTITASNDLRIAIATSSVDMRWYSSDAVADTSGTAVDNGRVTNPVTVEFEGGNSVIKIPVDVSFEAGETLTISGLSFDSFSAVNSGISALDVYTGGPNDVASDADDSKTVTITGTMSEDDSNTGQEDNKFSGVTSVSSAEIFSFRLAPSNENYNITNLVLDLKGVRGIEQADMTNAKLYIDYGGAGGTGNGSYDAGLDEAVGWTGGGGTVSISGVSGTVTFSESFQATTTRDYIFTADISNINPGDEFTIKLRTITSSGVTSGGNVSVTGSASHALHIKVSTAGYAPVGESVVGGAGDETGGEETAGEEIGDEVGFNTATSTGATFTQWTTASNAYDNVNGTYATTNLEDSRQDYANFGFYDIPATDTIDGIEVKIEASGSVASGNIGVELSWNGGSATTTTATTTPTLTTSDVVYRLGSPSYKWGEDWSVSELSNDNFRVRVVAHPGISSVKIDAIQVKVYHSATGGGGGGGDDELIYQWPPVSEYLFADIPMTDMENIFANVANVFMADVPTINR